MFWKIYLIAVTVFLVIDMVWLTVIAKNFYRKHIGFLLRDTFNIAPAILFYLIFLFALVIFVIMPAIEKGSWSYGLAYAALFGLVTYATYDLTNHATIKNWPLIVTVVDLLWGMFIASAVTLATFFIYNKIGW